MDETTAGVVAAAAACAALIDATQAHLMLAHLALVLARNETLNLTAITTFEEAVTRHIVDSLTAVPEITETPAGPLADLGSGAGYPGIPLGVATGRRVTLVESVKKKAGFLAEVISELGLDADVAAERSEELARHAPCAYACVVSRAVAGLPALVEMAAPLLKRGGRMIALKGADIDSEIDAGDAAAAVCGMRRCSVRTVSVPGVPEPRTLVAYSREGETSVPLPRRPGMAAKRPLG